MGLEYHRHVFHSPQFHSVVTEAIAFLNNTPVQELPPPVSFVGAGVYALYYSGHFDLYARIADRNRNNPNQPIYVGKAVPFGWRTSRQHKTSMAALYRRRREHARSLQQATNLEVSDFQCRFMILGGVESDLVIPVEAELIRNYTPLWNAVVDGFGNHAPGSGRFNQAKSEWDVLHPGRPWAEKLTGKSPDFEKVVAKIQGVLAKPS